MEVETQYLSNFDIVNSKSSFSYAAANECRTFDVVDFHDVSKRNEDDNMESTVIEVADEESPAKDDRKCEDAVFVSASDVVVNPAAEVETNVNVAVETSVESSYAVKLQKMYRGHRTRRRLADSAVVAEELWWQALDFARLNHSTVSFFNFSKPETVFSRWNRISLNASKVGKGLSKDAKAQKLAFQHWIEAIDPRHRYGHSLHLYFEEWVKTDAGQPFFYWLDIGDGKETDLKECPRSKLRQQCIKYLGPQEREHYEYIVFEEKLVHKQTGNPLDTNEESKGAKWIFVMSTFQKLYVGEKKKGIFHHSSFLAGGATLAAGRLIVEHGVLKSISAYSGHYRPTEERLNSFLSILSDKGVDLNGVQIHKANEDYNSYSDDKSDVASTKVQISIETESYKSNGIPHEEKDLLSEPVEVTKAPTKTKYERTLSGGLQSPRAEVSKNAILQRINSKKVARSYQLGHQLSLKWSTGLGPRIGCVADYPLEVRLQALEFVNLSPRVPPSPSIYRSTSACASPTDHAQALAYSNGAESTI